MIGGVDFGIIGDVDQINYYANYGRETGEWYCSIIPLIYQMIGRDKIRKDGVQISDKESRYTN